MLSCCQKWSEKPCKNSQQKIRKIKPWCDTGIFLFPEGKIRKRCRENGPEWMADGQKWSERPAFRTIFDHPPSILESFSRHFFRIFPSKLGGKSVHCVYFAVPQGLRHSTFLGFYNVRSLLQSAKSVVRELWDISFSASILNFFTARWLFHAPLFIGKSQENFASRIMYVRVISFPGLKNNIFVLQA